MSQRIRDGDEERQGKGSSAVVCILIRQIILVGNGSVMSCCYYAKYYFQDFIFITLCSRFYAVR